MTSFVARIDEPDVPQGPHLAFPRSVWGLEIVRGQARQLFRPIAGPVFMIGTAEDSDLVLADEAFPESFLYLYIKADAEQNEVVSVRRFGVGPALLVDEVETDIAELPIGSVLEFGDYAFRLTQRTSQPWPGDDPGRGPNRDPDRNDDEPFLPADFAAWERDESAALDKVRALLAAVRASLQAETHQQGLRLFAGPQAHSISSRPLRKQSA
jgi:hypothetical protein